mmetsp:Transcript_44268/g.73806  ORF Transcript_44268/g.73806 Transcript_44268/m.73806 type:complete len:328 (+) Transcript_44268:1952-2935(+)
MDQMESALDQINKNLPEHLRVYPSQIEQKQILIEEEQAEWRKKAHERLHAIGALREQFIMKGSSNISLPEKKIGKNSSNPKCLMGEMRRSFPLLCGTSRAYKSLSTSRNMQISRPQSTATVRRIKGQRRSTRKPTLWYSMVKDLLSNLNGLRSKLIKDATNHSGNRLKLLHSLRTRKSGEVIKIEELLTSMFDVAMILWDENQWIKNSICHQSKPEKTLEILRRRSPNALTHSEMAILCVLFKEDHSKYYSFDTKLVRVFPHLTKKFPKNRLPVRFGSQKCFQRAVMGPLNQKIFPKARKSRIFRRLIRRLIREFVRRVIHLGSSSG